MESAYLFLTTILIGAIIGYFTNAVAIFLLFHPRKKSLGMQGVIPKRKEKLAESISSNIHIILPPAYQKIKSLPYIGEGIDSILKSSISKTIRKTKDEELEQLINRVINKELQFIKWAGAVLGAIIGLIQGLILLYI